MLIVVGLQPCSLKIVAIEFFDVGWRRTVNPFLLWTVYGKMLVVEPCLELATVSLPSFDQRLMQN